MAQLSKTTVLKATLRRDLFIFVAKVFQTVSPGDQYVHSWHIEAIAHELTRCRDGENNRLLITQPPRSLKSICTSVAFAAWALGHDPKLRFICVSYSQDLAVELSRQFRMVVESDWYQTLFPQMRIKKLTSNECVTTAGGGRIATSIGGTLTGRGADFIIIDDPLKAEDAQSSAARKSVIDWYSGTLTSRLNDKRTGRIIIVMQRLHEEDLAGYVAAASDNWRHLDLPAIALEDETVVTGSGKSHDRKHGEPLQEKREPLEVLEKLKSELGSLTFSAQYQQRPIPLEGNVVKRKWFGRFDKAPEGAGVQIVQSWDTASTTSNQSDYSACITAAIYTKRYYILDVWRGQLTYPDLKRKIVSHARRWRPNTMLIEKAGPGLPLYQELSIENHEACPRPIGVTPGSDKIVRLEAVSAIIERGDVLLPENEPWLDIFLNELLSFPSGKHDDQVDAFSQLLNWSKNRRKRRISTFGGEVIFGDD
jgi:predicted phage terminase large subunit-like protein